MNGIFTRISWDLLKLSEIYIYNGNCSWMFFMIVHGFDGFFILWEANEISLDLLECNRIS